MTTLQLLSLLVPVLAVLGLQVIALLHKPQPSPELLDRLQRLEQA